VRNFLLILLAIVIAYGGGALTMWLVMGRPGIGAAPMDAKRREIEAWKTDMEHLMMQFNKALMTPQKPTTVQQKAAQKKVDDDAKKVLSKLPGFNAPQ
jgi:hypothetical protein